MNNDPNDCQKLTLIAELMNRGFDNDEELNGLLHEAYDAGVAEMKAKLAALEGFIRQLSGFDTKKLTARFVYGSDEETRTFQIWENYGTKDVRLVVFGQDCLDAWQKLQEQQNEN